MRTPVSWIRDYAALPDGLATTDLAHRLTALGLKLEALEQPGAEITGPLVVGRVLTMEPEPQKNGKTINWCTVDVGDANGSGEPQGIVCGAHNFAPGDLVVVVLPGGVLPGGFEISARKTYGHVSAGMICSARELGLGDDHEGIIVLPAEAGEPGADARPVLGLDEEVIEFEINPDRAYALSLRGIAREAAMAYDVPFTDPCGREVPAANDDGYPVRVDDALGCPVFVARTVTGFDPAAPTPDWLATRIRLAGMRPISLAVDVTNYVMLETGRPIHGYDGDRLQGPLVVRRAAAGERLRTLDGSDRVLSVEDLVVCDDSGVIGLGGVMGGAGDRDLRGDDDGRGRGGALGRGLDVPHRQASQAHLRGRQAQRARGRPHHLRGGGRPGRRAAHDLRRRHRRSGGDRGRHAARSARRSPLASALPGRVAGLPDRGRAGAFGLWSRSARPSTATTTLAVVPPPWRPDLQRPLRPGRGGGPDRRLRPGAVGAADAAGRPRTDP